MIEQNLAPFTPPLLLNDCECPVLLSGSKKLKLTGHSNSRELRRSRRPALRHPYERLYLRRHGRSMLGDRIRSLRRS